jgi:hypothetical protein
MDLEPGRCYAVDGARRHYGFAHPHLLDFYYRTSFDGSQSHALQIMRAFEKEGIEFAFPTTTTYLTQDAGQPLHVQFEKDSLPDERGHRE